MFKPKTVFPVYWREERAFFAAGVFLSRNKSRPLSDVLSRQPVLSKVEGIPPPEIPTKTEIHPLQGFRTIVLVADLTQISLNASIQINLCKLTNNPMGIKSFQGDKPKINMLLLPIKNDDGGTSNASRMVFLP